VERAFAERVVGLPGEARRALLVAAVSSSGRVEPVVEALRWLELDERSLELAEDAALVGFDGGRVTFRHPLVRSAVVHGAAASERRRAHRALADALADGSQEERAWHLAAAALGPDEQAAAALAEAACGRERAVPGHPRAGALGAADPRRREAPAAAGRGGRVGLGGGTD
jgi:hypothetical protein